MLSLLGWFGFVLTDSARVVVQCQTVVLHSCCRTARRGPPARCPRVLLPTSIGEDLSPPYNNPRQVSLFLQNETQEGDGSIVVPIGGVLPYNTFPPGIISYPQQDYRQEHIGIISAGLYGHSEGRISRVNLTGNPLTNLGQNMFNQNRESGSASGAAGASGTGQVEAGTGAIWAGRS